MKIQVLTVNPKMAEDWLLRNTINRKLRKSHVQAFVRAIKSGQWKVTHQGVAFGASGNLLDGQHRLSAIVEAGVPVQMVVAVGLDDEAFKAIDTGSIQRTISDVLSMPVSKVSIYNFFARLMRQDGTNKVSVHEAEEAIKVIGPFVDELMDFCGTSRNKVGVCEVRAGAVAAMMESKDHDYVKLMFRSVVTSQFEDMTPVVRCLYRQLTETRAKIDKNNKEVFARSFFAFLPDNAEKRNIYIHSTQPLLDRARAVYRLHESASPVDSSGFLDNLMALERAAA